MGTALALHLNLNLVSQTWKMDLEVTGSLFPNVTLVSLNLTIETTIETEDSKGMGISQAILSWKKENAPAGGVRYKEIPLPQILVPFSFIKKIISFSVPEGTTGALWPHRTSKHLLISRLTQYHNCLAIPSTSLTHRRGVLNLSNAMTF